MPRLTREEKYQRIRELYKAGWTYRQLMRQYRVSPNLIRKLTEVITIRCARCNRVKGPREKFELHHPDKQNRQDFTVPLCKACHLAVTLEERKAKPQESPPPTFDRKSPIEELIERLEREPVTSPVERSMRQALVERLRESPTSPLARQPTPTPAPPPPRQEPSDSFTLPDWLAKALFFLAFGTATLAVGKTIYDRWKESWPQMVEMGGAHRRHVSSPALVGPEGATPRKGGETVGGGIGEPKVVHEGYHIPRTTAIEHV
jgi:hypothetical protein